MTVCRRCRRKELIRATGGNRDQVRFVENDRDRQSKADRARRRERRRRLAHRIQEPVGG